MNKSIDLTLLQSQSLSRPIDAYSSVSINNRSHRSGMSRGLDTIRASALIATGIKNEISPRGREPVSQMARHPHLKLNLSPMKESGSPMESPRMTMSSRKPESHLARSMVIEKGVLGSMGVGEFVQTMQNLKNNGISGYNMTSPVVDGYNKPTTNRFSEDKKPRDYMSTMLAQSVKRPGPSHYKINDAGGIQTDKKLVKFSHN